MKQRGCYGRVEARVEGMESREKKEKERKRENIAKKQIPSKCYYCRVWMAGEGWTGVACRGATSTRAGGGEVM